MMYHFHHVSPADAAFSASPAANEALALALHRASIRLFHVDFAFLPQSGTRAMLCLQDADNAHIIVNGQTFAAAPALDITGALCEENELTVLFPAGCHPACTSLNGILRVQTA